MGIKLIGVHGRSGSGKDTFAQTLIIDHGFHRMAFADPVKAAAAVIFGWTPEQVGDDEFKKSHSDYWGISVRSAFQKVGTDSIRRTFGDDHWVKRWILDYAPISERCSVVVTDVREEKEAAAIRKFGGLIVHIHRKDSGLKGKEALHSSERGIMVNNRDIVINNDGTLEELSHHAHIAVQLIENEWSTFGLRNVDSKA